jgi:3-oxoadipate enol-lactonase
MERTVSANGINLHYYDTDGAGGKPVVLLAHGLGGCFEAWEFQIPVLEQAGFRVIAVDLRGHGRSDKPHDPYTMKILAGDLAALLDQLSVGPVAVVGHSLGGMVSTQLAGVRPDLVSRLVIINSFAKIPAIRPKGIFKLVFRTSVIYGLGLRAWGRWLSWELLPGTKNSSLRRRLMELAEFNTDRTAYVNAMLAAVRADLRPMLGRLQCPVLIMSADRDYTPTSNKEEDVRTINASRQTPRLPQARVVEIPDSRHFSPWDQADFLNRELLLFLTQE